jgi:citrate lyase subunit beta / citryl-CoA lyase
MTVDAVHIDIADIEGLHAEADDAAAVGFAATTRIHPSQVSVICSTYRPTKWEYQRAAFLLAKARLPVGAFQVQVQMVDEPVLRQAVMLLEHYPKPTEVRT